MNPATLELLAHVRRLGVTFKIDGERLRFAPRDRLPAELIDRLRQHKAAVIAALARGATVETANALPARREAPTVAVESEAVEQRRVIAGNVGDSGAGFAVADSCDSMRGEQPASLMVGPSPPAESAAMPAHAREADDDANPFADWILRPDLFGKLGWEPPDLPEAVRWWARIRI